MTRDEAMRQIAALNRQAWLSRAPGSSESDYQASAMLAALGQHDAFWRGSSGEDAELARQIDAILAQVEE